TLELAWGTRIDQAMADVREKLDRVELPTTAARPLVLRYDPSQEPIMRLALRGTEGRVLTPADLATLREVADRIVKRELEKLPGVAAVDLHGGEEDEVLVEIDPWRLWALELSADDVIAALQRDNVNRPGGALTERDNRYLIRTIHEAKTPEEFGDVIVRSSDGAELRLREIATIRRAPIVRGVLGLVAGAEAVELAGYGEGVGNCVDVARRVEAQLASLPLPPGLEVIVSSSQAEFVEAAVNDVRDAALQG